MSLKRIFWKEGSSFGKWFFIVFFILFLKMVSLGEGWNVQLIGCH